MMFIIISVWEGLRKILNALISLFSANSTVSFIVGYIEFIKLKKCFNCLFVTQICDYLVGAYFEI